MESPINKMDSDSDSNHQSDTSESETKPEHKEINDIFGEISDESDDEGDNKEIKTEDLKDKDDEFIKTEQIVDQDNDDEDVEFIKRDQIIDQDNDDEDDEFFKREKIIDQNNDDDDEFIKREQIVDQDMDDEDDDEDDINRDIFQQFEEEEQPETETRIDVEIPKITTDLGNESHFVKLPNFLSVEAHPYDPSWYEDEIDDDEVLDEEGRARMKLKVENTIRWRNVVDKDGNQQRESNARVVKWSDGSMSLHLGPEIFDIHKQHILSGDNHLYIRQGTGLLGQSVFKTKLTFRPHSTDSFTHKKMTLSLADRSQKTHKIRVLPTVGFDPEANRTDRIKKEEDKLRASLRRENKARRVRERINQRGPTSSYLEPDLEEEGEDGAISISAIKNKFKQRAQSYADVYSDDDSDSESSSGSIIDRKKSISVKKTVKISESDED